MRNNTAYQWDYAMQEDRYLCEITRTTMILEDKRWIDLYGLRLYNVIPHKTVQDGEAVRVDGITDSLEEIGKLKQLIDELGVYPVHLKEIVEDYLS